MTVPSVALADGNHIPAIGLGTYPMADAEAEGAVRQALGAGYRLIDTAASYGNEVGVGRGLATSDVPRADVVLTTKLRGRDHGYDKALAAFETSRQRLGVEYVDLYLIHWPLPRVDRYVDAWRAMIKLRDEGLARSIGVSNFTGAQLDRLTQETGVSAAVNQIELHPYFPQPEMRAADIARDVCTESWSPLGRGTDLLDEPAVVDAAQRYEVTPGQVVLRWHVQLGVVPIPKSASAERQRENLAIFDFALDDTEMVAVAKLARSRLGGDPESHEEF